MWTVTLGPSLPLALIGHCIANLNDHEILIAGGFSPRLDDYSEDTYIYDTLTQEWRSDPWMKLKHGPRIDAACDYINWYNETRLIMVGGWNNTALRSTEIYDRTSDQWDIMERDGTNVKYFPPLEHGIRSTALLQLNGLTVVAGGVKCYG